MNKTKLHFMILRGVLFSLAGLLVVYTIWALIHCARYIGDLISSGQVSFAGNVYDIVSFYVSSCAQYAVFAVILIALGMMSQKNAYIESNSENGAYPNNLENEKNDKELDEWFQRDNK